MNGWNLLTSGSSQPMLPTEVIGRLLVDELHNNLSQWSFAHVIMCATILAVLVQISGARI